MANEKQVTGYSAKLYIERRTMTTETVSNPYEPDKVQHNRDELIEVSVSADNDSDLREKLVQLINTALPQCEVAEKSEGVMYRG